MPSIKQLYAGCLITVLTLATANTMAAKTSFHTGRKPADPVPDTLREAALAHMPVKEITVFKDGHAFVLHEGQMKADPAGNVTLDYLPTPVIGTFWPYSSDPNAKLVSVVAGKRKVQVDKTALDLQQLLEANIAAAVTITETDGKSYPATIIGIPRQTTEPQSTTNPNHRGSQASSRPTSPAKKGSVIVLQTHQGTKVLPLNRIQDVTFENDPKRSLPDTEYRNLLTLNLEWTKDQPQKNVNVGLVYLQKGIRWIPSYKVNIDGKGTAHIQLQATLLNEMTDLTNVTAHLVIGVPTFAFKDTIDPISLQETAARLSQHFQQNAQTLYAFSNAIMSQSTIPSEHQSRRRPAPPANLGPDMPDAVNTEDLFVFTIPNITLKKGCRMVLPITEFSLPYKDVYTLNIPFVPPPETRNRMNNQQHAELAKLMAAPKVMHNIRLTNNSQYPLTTAPALILKDGRVIAQNMMTFAASGSTTDLTITAAVDIKVKKIDIETERQANAKKWHGDHYDLVKLAGIITLTNHRSHTVELEVDRHVLGNADTANQNGQITKIAMYQTALESWSSYWRHYFNGISHIKWKFNLETGKTIDLNCTWHYYYRQ
ncbi:MAG: hypothetical protein ACYTF1_12005 [Planctomycetota bacterium]|jgi:hypothetical protein